MKKLWLALLISLPIIASKRNIPEGSILFFDYSLLNHKAYEAYTFDEHGQHLCDAGDKHGKHLCDAGEVLAPYMRLFKDAQKQHEMIYQKIELYESIRPEIEQAFKDKMINAQDRQAKIKQVNEKLNQFNHMRSELFKEHLRICGELRPKILKIIKDIAIKAKASAVLQKTMALCLHPTYDITQEVIDRINAEYDKFSYQRSCYEPHCKLNRNNRCPTGGPIEIIDLSL